MVDFYKVRSNSFIHIHSSIQLGRHILSMFFGSADSDHGAHHALRCVRGAPQPDIAIARRAPQAWHCILYGTVWMNVLTIHKSSSVLQSSSALPSTTLVSTRSHSCGMDEFDLTL